MLGACRYTGRLRQASILGDESAKFQGKPKPEEDAENKDYLQHIDRIHDRMFLMPH